MVALKERWKSTIYAQSRQSMHRWSCPGWSPCRASAGRAGGVTVRVPQLLGWRKTPCLGRAAFSGHNPCNFPLPASVSHLMRGGCCRLIQLWEGLTTQQSLPERHEELPRGTPWGCALSSSPSGHRTPPAPSPAPRAAPGISPAPRRPGQQNP